MDKNYADTARLLLAVAPKVFANTIFAMKGGPAHPNWRVLGLCGRPPSSGWMALHD